MRETDPTRPAPEPALEPDALAEPAAPVVPGIPVDDDDILADTFVEGDLPPLPVEALQPPDEFDDMNLEESEPEPRRVTAADSVELEVDVELEEPEAARVLALVNSESSLSMELPVPESDAPKGPSRRTSAAQLRHDLRTPFNQIIGYSEMLIEDAEASSNEFVLGNIGRVLTDAQQLLALIDEILDPHAQRPSQERLNRDLLFPLSHLLSHVERLVATAHQRGQDEVTADIERIQEAVKRLDEIVSSGAVTRALSTTRQPLEPTPAVREAPEKRTPVLAHSDTGKILVVDDNESNRNMLSRRLERQGHRVKLAEDGKRALEMLREEDFDLVLLDVMMPEMDGYQVLEHLHADDKLRGLPVIMISALDQLDTVVKSIELGAEDYLPKPFNPVVLRARIGACLEKKRLRDRERAYIKKLRSEQERSEQLLLNILPRPIAERLKEGQRTIADVFPDVTVLFADLVGFTRMSEQLPPAELVAMLNKIFSMFDQLAEKHGLEKIKTIGDEYMAASGLPMPRPDHAEAMAEMALDMLAVIERFNTKRKSGVRIRIGMNCGPVTAGIIGTKKFAYDLWGDTVNIASRMESHGIANAIQVTESTYKRLRHKYAFQRRGIIHVKGKGALCTYFLVGRRPAKLGGAGDSSPSLAGGGSDTGPLPTISAATTGPVDDEDLSLE
nr:adenylate/guanylate cyclase domain-containing protein [Nannocystis sp.]